ncbi:MAG: ferrous iron transporter B [Ruminococcaceae bacterium]|nr:ferrous iron transporter B [Oscillospiraceae bacterium]
MRIALAGNPNSGKTTMYNALTGRNEKVGNWAGVTVEKKEHEIKKSLYNGREEVIIVDLPGAYSMSPFTAEESVTSDYIKNEMPDVIINIVDATNLSRSLFFTTQLLELNVPVVVALNKSDINKKKENRINAERLSEKINCPVIETISTSSEGVENVVKIAVEQAGKGQFAPFNQGNVDLTNKAQVKEADKRRFEFVKNIVKEVETRKVFTKDRNSQDKIDAILTNRWVGLPIFAVVMFLVLWISQYGPGVWIADSLVALLEAGQESVGSLLENASPLLSALLVDGVIGGVIAVIGFLPLVMVMYFLIALLEDCGYMARASVVLDPIFKKVGLSGKSIIPFVITTGCAVPGVMASRTIRNERERRATAMLAPFMPCGAKLPVIALFSGVFFGDAKWVGPVMYFVGIMLIFFGALLVNKVAGYKVRKSFFIIELPEYKIPSLLRATKSMLSRGWAYVVKAATVILLCNTAVQIMQTFTWKFQVAESAEESILASVSSPFAYLLIPVVGVLSWQLAAAAVTGFIAKENVVGTLAVCFSITNFINVDALVLEGGASEVAATMGLTASAALAYLMFNLYSPPCFAALAAMSSEMKSAKWFWGGIALQLGTGFTVGFLVYQIGTLITTGAVGVGFSGGLIAVLVFVAVLAVLIIRANKRIEVQYTLKAKEKITK